MITNLEKIKNILQSSGLSSQDQNELLTLFSFAVDEELELLVGLFSKDKTYITVINENYKRKKEALATRNMNLWQKIVQDEAAELKKLEET